MRHFFKEWIELLSAETLKLKKNPTKDWKKSQGKQLLKGRTCRLSNRHLSFWILIVLAFSLLTPTNRYFHNCSLSPMPTHELYVNNTKCQTLGKGVNIWLLLLLSCSVTSNSVITWTAPCQASLLFTIRQSLLKLRSIELIWYIYTEMDR